MSLQAPAPVATGLYVDTGAPMLLPDGGFPPFASLPVFGHPANPLPSPPSFDFGDHPLSDGAAFGLGPPSPSPPPCAQPFRPIAPDLASVQVQGALISREVTMPQPLSRSSSCSTTNVGDVPLAPPFPHPLPDLPMADDAFLAEGVRSAFGFTQTTEKQDKPPWEAGAPGAQPAQPKPGGVSTRRRTSTRRGLPPPAPENGRKRVDWSKGEPAERMRQAIEECRAVTRNPKGGGSWRSVSAKYGIPWAVLHPRLTGRIALDTPLGARASLPREVEEVLYKHIRDMANNGTGLDWTGVRLAATRLADGLGFDKFRATDGWVRQFQLRFPQLKRARVRIDDDDAGEGRAKRGPRYKFIVMDERSMSPTPSEISDITTATASLAVPDAGLSTRDSLSPTPLHSYAKDMTSLPPSPSAAMANHHVGYPTKICTSPGPVCSSPGGLSFSEDTLDGTGYIWGESNNLPPTYLPPPPRCTRRATRAPTPRQSNDIPRDLSGASKILEELAEGTMRQRSLSEDSSASQKRGAPIDDTPVLELLRSLGFVQRTGGKLTVACMKAFMDRFHLKMPSLGLLRARRDDYVLALQSVVNAAPPGGWTVDSLEHYGGSQRPACATPEAKRRRAASPALDMCSAFQASLLSDETATQAPPPPAPIYHGQAPLMMGGMLHRPVPSALNATDFAAISAGLLSDPAMEVTELATL